MKTEDNLIHQRELLVLECKQSHDNIQRCLSEMYKLLALGFPVLTGAFTLALKGGQSTGLDLATLYSLFALIIGVLAVAFNSAWLQLLSFVKYKYSEVLPRLYNASYAIGENYGQYSIGQGTLKTFASAAITQLLLLPTAIASVIGAMCQPNYSVFFVPAIITIILAIISTVFSWFSAKDVVKSVNESRKFDKLTSN